MKCEEIQDKFYKYLKKELGITSRCSYIISDILNLYTNKEQLKKINLGWLFEQAVINNIPKFQIKFKEEIDKIKEFVKTEFLDTNKQIFNKIEKIFKNKRVIQKYLKKELKITSDKVIFEILKDYINYYEIDNAIRLHYLFDIFSEYMGSSFKYLWKNEIKKIKEFIKNINYELKI